MEINKLTKNNNEYFPIHNYINLIPYLTILDIKNLNNLSKSMNEYITYHKYSIHIQSSNVIKKFFKYSHQLFCDSKKYPNDMLTKIKKSNKFYKKLKFIYVNLLYMDEYTLEFANGWIKNSCEYKKSLVEKYMTIDNTKKYSKYDLNKLMLKMKINDIFYIGW